MGMAQLRPRALGIERIHDTWAPRLRRSQSGRPRETVSSAPTRDTRKRHGVPARLPDVALRRPKPSQSGVAALGVIGYGRILAPRSKRIGSSISSSPSSRPAAAGASVRSATLRTSRSRPRAQRPTVMPRDWSCTPFSSPASPRTIPRSKRALTGCGRIKIPRVPGVPRRSTNRATRSRKTRRRPMSASSCGTRRQATRCWH